MSVVFIPLGWQSLLHRPWFRIILLVLAQVNQSGEESSDTPIKWRSLPQRSWDEIIGRIILGPCSGVMGMTRVERRGQHLFLP